MDIVRDDKWTDIIVATADGHEIHAHMCVLVQCEYIYRLITDTGYEPNLVVAVPFKYKQVWSFLKAIYGRTKYSRYECALVASYFDHKVLYTRCLSSASVSIYHRIRLGMHTGDMCAFDMEMTLYDIGTFIRHMLLMKNSGKLNKVLSVVMNYPAPKLANSMAVIGAAVVACLGDVGLPPVPAGVKYCAFDYTFTGDRRIIERLRGLNKLIRQCDCNSSIHDKKYTRPKVCIWM